jgi:hypothetical protein
MDCLKWSTQQLLIRELTAVGLVKTDDPTKFGSNRNVAAKRMDCSTKVGSNRDVVAKRHTFEYIAVRC